MGGGGGGVIVRGVRMGGNCPVGGGGGGKCPSTLSHPMFASFICNVNECTAETI